MRLRIRRTRSPAGHMPLTGNNSPWALGPGAWAWGLGQAPAPVPRPGTPVSAYELCIYGSMAAAESGVGWGQLQALRVPSRRCSGATADCLRRVCRLQSTCSSHLASPAISVLHIPRITCSESLSIVYLPLTLTGALELNPNGIQAATLA
jgi:hypothetical protein